MTGSAKKPVARIGFELPWPIGYDATGFCAAEWAIDQANERGDLPFHIELVLLNDERDPEKARQVARQFGDEPTALGVLGPLNSAMSWACQETYHEAGFAHLTSEATSPLLTSRGYRNYRRLVLHDARQGRAQAHVAIRYLNARRIVVLHDSTVSGELTADVFVAEAKNLGVEPVLVLGFADRERHLDFDEMVRATIATKPDLVYVTVYWNPAHIIAHQLRYARLEAPFLGTDALKHTPFLSVAGLDKVDPYHTYAGCDPRLKPETVEFMGEFVKRYPWTAVNIQYAPEGYDMANLLLEAIRRAGVIDRARVLAALQGIDCFEGICGTIRFDEYGDRLEQDMGLYQVHEGLRCHIGALGDLIPGFKP